MLQNSKTLALRTSFHGKSPLGAPAFGESDKLVTLFDTFVQFFLDLMNWNPWSLGIEYDPGLGLPSGNLT